MSISPLTLVKLVYHVTTPYRNLIEFGRPLTFISGTTQLGWTIWCVIWSNAGLIFWQEFQAEQDFAALKAAHVYEDISEHRLKQVPV
jgi:magnesium-transporting ATPase (P-type)